MKMMLRNGYYINLLTPLKEKKVKICLIFLLFFLLSSTSYSLTISERVEKNILKKESFQNLEVIFSKTGPFTVKKDGKEILTGGFWLAQGVIKEKNKVKFTHEEWQFNDFRGKLKGKIISESPLTIKIDSTNIAKETVGFKENLLFTGKTIKIKYEFEINKDTPYLVNIYVNFNFPEEIIDKDVKPVVDKEKVIYETKKGPVIISYSSDFTPDRFSPFLWKAFRVYIRFPNGFKKGEKRKGEITITLP